MKATIFRRKARAFLGAAMVLAAVFGAGCKLDEGEEAPAGDGKPPAPVMYTVVFSAGEHGALSASVDGQALTPDAKGAAKVEKGKTVTFTAKPADGYGVDKWSLSSGKFLAGGTDGSTSATLAVTADAKVSVSFKTLPPGKYTVVMTHGRHGTISANPELPADGIVVKDTEITFTATPAFQCSVNAWTVEGGTVLAGGKVGNNTVKVKITKNTTVNVTFNPPPREYVRVAFSAGEHGAISASVDGKALKPDAKGGAKVEKETAVTFTATPAESYGVDAWSVTGGAFLSGGTAGSASAILKVSADATVAVSFKKLPPGRYTVAINHGPNGSISANPDITAGGTVAKDTEITFTATPAEKFTVASWTIEGGTVLAGGKAGDETAKVKITKNTTVSVMFIQPPLEYARVAFSAGEHGTISAAVGGKALAADAKGGAKVEKGAVVTFTAKPADGYGVEKWSVTSGAFLSGGTAGAATATLKVSADATVAVSFKKLPPGMFTVAMTHGENGDITANPAIPVGGTVAKDTEVTFTAKAASGYYADAWSIVGGALLSGGQDGDDSAKVKITGNTTVSVTFSRYKKVAFSKLNDYLAAASSHSVNYIEVTALAAADVKGDGSSRPYEASALGKILNANKGKEVALKFGKSREELTDMSYCFAGCTNLAKAPDIPAGVKIVRGCFSGCENLPEAPALPESVTDMRECFSGCKKLMKAPQIPANVTNMRECFFNCGKLTRAPAIPEGVKDMSGCFGYCTSLEQPPTIPGSVRDLSDCFAGCKKLTSAPAIPEGVTNISGCFYNCKKITQAPKIPESVTDMSKCFYGSENLLYPPKLPAHVSNISGCFQGCVSLLAAPGIPSGVKNLSGCFDGCVRLTVAPTLPDGITDLSNCFADCKNLIQAPKIPESVQNLDGCFAGCLSLTQAPALPTGVINARRCFTGCKNLTQAPEIPAGVTNLYQTFSGCAKIQTVTLKCKYNSESLWGYKEPFPAFGDAFTGCPRLKAGSIKVPAAHLDAYKANAAKMGAQPAYFIAG